MAVGLPIVAADAGGTVVTVMGASGAGGVVAVNVAVVAVSIGAAGVGASAVGVASGRGEAGNVVTGEGSSSTLQAMSVRADAKATRIKVKIRIAESHSTFCGPFCDGLHSGEQAYRVTDRQSVGTWRRPFPLWTGSRRRNRRACQRHS